MIIPWQQLSPEALKNVLDSFILREGTDYGERELSLAEKRANLYAQLESGNAVIVWSELSQSLDIKEKKTFLGNG